MSGEPRIVLPGAAMAPLVRAAAEVADAGLGRYAVIGGIAVSARLGQVHRATADIDAVVDDATPPPAVETLLELPQGEADPSGPHRVLIDGIKIEIQGTEPFESSELDGLTAKQILYVGSHRYALESATAVTLVAEDGGAPVTEAHHRRRRQRLGNGCRTRRRHRRRRAGSLLDPPRPGRREQPPAHPGPA